MILLTDQNSIRRKYIYQYLGSIPKSADSLVVIFYYFCNTSQAARRPYDYSLAPFDLTTVKWEVFIRAKNHFVVPVCVSVMKIGFLKNIGDDLPLQ